jgi:glycosidase
MGREDRAVLPHSFLKEQPDLNWRNPDVLKAMFDVYRFCWIAVWMASE